MKKRERERKTEMSPAEELRIAGLGDDGKGEREGAGENRQRTP